MPETPPFFRIPLELRNRIYHFALLASRPVFTHFAATHFTVVELHTSYAHRAASEEQEVQNLRWLLTSHRVLSEGLEQFYQHAALENCYIVRNTGCVSHELSLDGKTSIFSLARIRYARLSVTMGKTWSPDSLYEDIVPRGKERKTLIDEDFGELGRAIAGLEGCALRELEMDVHLFRTYDHTGDWEAAGNRFIVRMGGGSDDDGDEDGDDDEAYDSDDSYNEHYWNAYGTNLSEPSEVNGYVADFSFLKNLGASWEKVTIKYTPTYMERYWGDSDPVAANVLAVPVIEESLAETAKELVGGEGWALRDSLPDENGFAAVWMLIVERRGKTERTGALEHVGLHGYLAPCEECSQREERFWREPGEEGMVRFVGKDCGAVVEFETIQLKMSDFRDWDPDR